MSGFDKISSEDELTWPYGHVDQKGTYFQRVMMSMTRICTKIGDIAYN